MREACATCEMGYVRAIYVLVMRLFLVHIDRHKCVRPKSAGQTVSQELHAQRRVRCERVRPRGLSLSLFPSMSSDGLKEITDTGHDTRCTICEPTSFYPVHEQTFLTYPDVHVSLQFAAIGDLQRTRGRLLVINLFFKCVCFRVEANPLGPAA